MQDKVQKMSPEIRFKGYTDAWVLRKLGEVTCIYDGTHQTPSYKKQGIMFLSVENIKTLYSNKFISKEAFEKEFKVYPTFHDVLMTRIGDVGTSNVVTSNDKIAYYVSLALLKPKTVESYFLNAAISSTRVQKEFWKRTLHIAFPKKINKNEIEKVSIKYPNLSEQKAIGSLFKKLDNLITLQQRKIDTLKLLKKALLQQMFPEKEEDIPRVRFANFKDKWGQRKLGEIAPIRGGFSFKSSDFTTTGIAVVKISNILRNEVVGGDFVHVKELSDDKKISLYDESILIAMSGATTGKIATIRKQSNQKVYQNQRVGYFTKTELVDYQLVSILVRTTLFLEQLNTVLIAGAQPNISSKDIDDFNFYIPRLINEQRKIGMYFNKLDEYIDVLNQKSLKFESIKKSLLQKMFT